MFLYYFMLFPIATAGVSDIRVAVTVLLFTDQMWMVILINVIDLLVKFM